MAARAGDRPHPLFRHEPAAGRARDDERDQRGLLTACYVVLTPFVVWALSGARPRALVLGASFVSLVGAWLLATGGAFGPPNDGDGLVLVADFAWATGIALTPIFLLRPAGRCCSPSRNMRSAPASRRCPRALFESSPGRLRRHCADDPLCRPRLGRPRLYAPDFRPGPYAAGRGRSHSVA